MGAPAPIKTLATVGNAGDVIINAFLTVFVAFSQLQPAVPPFSTSVPFLFPSDPYYEMPPRAKQKRGRKQSEARLLWKCGNRTANGRGGGVPL